MAHTLQEQAGSAPGDWFHSLSARAPALLLFAAAVFLAGILLPGSRALAAGSAITNTAHSSWTNPKAPSVPVSVDSNDVSLTLLEIPACTPSEAVFYQHVPSAYPVPDARKRSFDGGAYAGGAGERESLEAPAALDGTALAPEAVESLPTGIYHAGEPVLVALKDGNRNIDPDLRETVEVALNSAYSSGDLNPDGAAPERETLYLLETGPDTGVFAAAVQTLAPSPEREPKDADGRLVLGVNARLTLNYEDPMCAGETAQGLVLVDPLGVVFDSVDGTPLSGATVSLVNAGDGSPATVYDDDGVTPISNTQVTGGGSPFFRFPYVPPGDYRLLVTPPFGYTVPSTVENETMPPAPDGTPYQVVQGSRGEVFSLAPGPALVVDIPADPSGEGLLLQKSVSNGEASVGDFLQYRLQLRSLIAAEASEATITDVIPAGMRYRAGSLSLNGERQPDPVISADGRTLGIPVGSLAAGAELELRYVLEVVAGARPGDAVNSASATALNPGGGALSSNLAQVAVRITEPLMSDRFTLVGRVFGGDCNTPWEERDGVAGVRLLLDDGTNVVTDADGRYHMEGLRPGSHVVQLDIGNLPAGWEPVSCIDNTRFAGSAYSQFVDARGGSLWRADFQLRPAEAGVRLHTEGAGVTDLVEKVEPRKFTFRGRFASGDDRLLPESTAQLQALLRELKGGEVLALEAVGHTDSQRLSPRAAAKFRDNYGLSMARAGTVADVLGWALGLSADRVTVGGMGPDQPLAANDTAAGMAQNRRVEVTVYGRVGPDTVVVGERLRRRHHIDLDTGGGAFTNLRVTAKLPEGLRYLAGSARLDDEAVPDPQQSGEMLLWRLPDGAAEKTGGTEPFRRRFSFQTEARHLREAPCDRDLSIKINALVDTAAGGNLRLPVAENRLGCGKTAEDGAARDNGKEHREKVDSGRLTVALTPSVGGEEPVASDSGAAPDVSSISAAGGDVDWSARAAGQAGFLFPPEKHNPRAPALRAVIAHRTGERVELTVNGKPAPALSFEGVEQSPGGETAISLWRALPLVEGDNQLKARLLDDSGRVLDNFTRRVHFANTPARALLLEEESSLVADGVSRPRVAVRILDRDGYPVRDGITGSVGISVPYEAWQSADTRQQRQLAGMDGYQPQYRVQGDEGIAWIELAPTTRSGAFTLDFRFHTGADTSRTQQLHGWMAPAARDWVVVGFAEGTLGYDTIESHMESLPDGEEEGVYTDGQLSFYAKGRVLGRWLLTMAYDSDKPRDNTLLSPIDPSRYYTLYGDGTTQVYGAVSRAKLYVKMERGQFYALFGDYETGLDKTRLSRYSRTLNGFKAESGGGPLVFNVFAADTEQTYARDEIQGDGTSGLYRLSYPGIVLNSERVRIETRDRVHSDRVLNSRTLTPYIDYEIDYAAGTLFFHQPVFSRDSDFNPVYIVAEYETQGADNRQFNGGGRVGLNLRDDSLDIGFSGLRDDSAAGRTDLAGADLSWRFADDSELRLEAAQSRGSSAGSERSGDAWLAELEHHSGRYDLLAYARRQDAEFGVNQQNLSNAGQRKTGAQGQLHLADGWSLQGEAYRQENLASDATRDAAIGRLRYETPQGSVSFGAQHIADELPAGASGPQSVSEANSSQALLAASRQLMEGRLDLSLQAETALSGDQRQSADYPDRYVLGATYAATDYAQLLAAQEFTEGDSQDTSSSRVGVQVTPWRGARLTSTLNQSRINRHGPRKYSQLGLSQIAMLGENWRLDFGLDSSHTLSDGGETPPVNSDASRSPFGQSSLAAVSEDFLALSAGATWRGDVWGWRGRLESRNGKNSDRHGLTSNFLRQARAGVAFASGLEAFRSDYDGGARGDLASLDLSWAWRPLNSQWSILNRLEFRYESVWDPALTGGGFSNPGGLYGFDSLSAADARSRRLINNFVLNRVSREWTAEDRQGNLFQRYERNQWSLYYGAKYVLDSFDGEEYSGYTDMLGVEIRHDLSEWLDLGLQASALNSWNAGTHLYSFGPQLGFSPVRDGWITLGWNLRGFRDRDFEAARYTAQGPYLQLRFKFDQNTRVGFDGETGDR
ncbi:OmpA family protein [Microbulbifer sp.]|uniref:OmpA family protein n=1 Tax=Microbulbifer sp. TaxID=1908541 RepID=UPI003F3FA6B9